MKKTFIVMSYYNHLTRDFDTLTDITDYVKANNIWEPRVGVEFKPREDLAFRAGYLYDKEAGPSKNITSTAPDITVHYIGFGATKKLKDFKMNITYELAIGDTRSVGDSAAGLNGDYDLTSHLLAISGSYRF